MTESMYNLIHTEVVPILFNKIMAHSSHSDTRIESPNTENDPTPLLLQILGKMYSLQDSLHINDSQTEANADILARDIKKLDTLCSTRFSNIAAQINELNLNENNRFEKVKRRLGDACSTLNSMSNRRETDLTYTVRQEPNNLQLNSSMAQTLPTPEEQALSPLIYNNPLMDLRTSASIHKPDPQFSSLQPTDRHYSRAPHTQIPSISHSLDEFPFIQRQDVDPEMRKELWRAIPKTSEWETFSGELPYNHEL